MNPIRIVVAEDEFFTRTGICQLLDCEPDMEVVGMAENGQEAIRLVKAHQPDLLLLDIRMPPGMDGVEVIQQLRKTDKKLLIVALTQEGPLIKAVQDAGGNGFIPKDQTEMFIPTVRCVAQTRADVFINPTVSKRYQALQAQVKQAQLTDLEHDVWRLIGFKNEEIAQRLFKSSGRIRNIVTDLYVKLAILDDGKVSQRVQAMEMARFLGVLESPTQHLS